MKKQIDVCMLITSLLVGGCQRNERRDPAVAEQAVPSAAVTTLTLSTDQLMSLDWDARAVGRPMVIDKRAVEGGIELDIRFPGNTPGVCSIDYTSSGSGGRGALIGLDVEEYEAFALKLSLVSVNGQHGSGLPEEVAVGALIGPAGDGRLFACEPLVLGFSPGRTTGVAKTQMRTQKIRVIGIHAHAVNPQTWNADGNVVTLRVEPISDAGVLASRSPVPERRSHTRSVYVPDFGPWRLGAW